MTISESIPNRGTVGEGRRNTVESREERALRHYRERNGDIVLYVDRVTFGVESGTIDDLVYRVNPEAGYCPCPDSEMRHNTCWHQLYATIHVAKMRSRGVAPARPARRCGKAPSMESRAA